MNYREFLTFVLGLVMILCGSHFLFVCTVTTELAMDWKFASALVIILAGLVIILLLRKDLRRSTITSLMAMGISIILCYMELLYAPRGHTDILQGDISIVIGAVLIYYSVSLIFHTSAGSIKALICLGLLVASEMLPIIYFLYMGNDFSEVITENRDPLVYGIMHLTILYILSRKEMLLEGVNKRLERNSKYLYEAMATPADSYLDVSDVSELYTYPGIGWVAVDGGGPVVEEKSVTLHRSDMKILLQKIRGDERVHFSLCPDEGGSFSVPISFPIESIVLDGEDLYSSKSVRIYGNDGLFMNILIMDYDKEKKTYIETIRYKWNKRKKMKRS